MRNQCFKPGAEALEGREVPATLVNGVTYDYDAAARTLTVRGTAGDDTLAVSLAQQDAAVYLRASNEAGRVPTFRVPGVRHTTPNLTIRVFGGEGEDRISVGKDFALPSSPAQVFLYGEGGDDDLTVQHAGINATLLGGDGNDWLVATRPNQAATLDGGAGDDILFILGPTGNQRLVLRGGDGRDGFLSHDRNIDGVRYPGHTVPQFLLLDTDFDPAQDCFANSQVTFGTRP